MESLKGKVVLITGASSGVGRSTAVYLSKFGCKLALTSRNAERLQQTKDACVEQGLDAADVICIKADLLVEKERQHIVDTTVGTFNKLDVVVNSAGIAIMNSITSTTEDDFLRIMKMNVVSPFRLVNLALPHLKQSKGNIVNISTIISEEPAPGIAAYCMSKAALDCYTKNLALELAEFGIRVNSVNPGYVRTDFLAHNTNFSKEEIEKVEKALVERHPLGRNAEPEDVAKSIAFLASDLSDYVTGQIIYAAGGRNCKPL